MQKKHRLVSWLARIGLLSVVLAVACAPAAPASPPAASDKAETSAAKSGAFDEQAVANFYTGKTIRFIAGDPGGSAVGLLLESASRQLGEHLPGSPKVAFENMPGGSGLVAGNYVYGAAKPDGLTVAGASAGMVGAGVAKPSEVQYDLNEFTWLANLDQTTVIFWIKSDFPCQTLEQLKNCPQQLRFASTGPTSVGFGVAPALVQEALGLNIRFIYGYKGSAGTTLAVEQKEADGSGGSWQTFRTTRTMDWLNKGEVKILLQVGARDKTLTEMGVPHINELAPDSYRNVLKVVDTMIVVSRPVFAPPDVPKDRAQALRLAFKKITEDPEFKADLERAKHPPLHPQTGGEVQEAFDDIFNQPPEVLQRVRKLLGQ